MPERECSGCTTKQKLEWGCTANARIPLDLDGERLFRCPRRPLLDDPELYSEVFWAHQQFSKGILPEEGGLLSQPGKLVDMFRVIDRAKNAVDRERMETRKKEEARRARGAQRRGGR